ncbi:MAG: RNA polymerase factor sigma-32 [Stagnimonas sp.]|nr:RNA polymerase factor sigma-32 [Stagnimonas sp.]
MQAISAIGVGDSFAAYLAAIRNQPQLSAEAEHALALKWREQGDRDSAQRLVLSQLRYVVHIARGYLGYRLPLADLVQEGNIGLTKAVQRFRPDWGVRLISYAVHWIKAQIHEYILRNFRLVRPSTGRAQKKLFFGLRQLRGDCGWMNAAEIERIARQLKVKASEVRQAETLFNGGDCPLSSPDGALAPEDWLRDPGPGPAEQVEAEDWNQHQLPRLRAALASLDARSRDILRRRDLAEDQPTGLVELGREYGISAERVRQIEVQTRARLRQALVGGTGTAARSGVDEAGLRRGGADDHPHRHRAHPPQQPRLAQQRPPVVEVDLQWPPQRHPASHQEAFA